MTSFRFVLVFVMSTFVGLSVTSCTAMKTLAEAQRMDREIRYDRIRHYKNIRDVYFVLGLDYYSLAKEAENNNNQAKAVEYANKAKLYHFIYEELNREVKRLINEFEESKKPEETSGAGIIETTPSA